MGVNEISLYQGNAVKFEFTIVDENGDALDLTNFDVMKFMVKAEKSDADTDALLTKTKTDMTVISATRGRVDLQLDGTDMDGVTVGRNYYEFVIEDTGNDYVYTVLEDYFTVLERVTDL